MAEPRKTRSSPVYPAPRRPPRRALSQSPGFLPETLRNIASEAGRAGGKRHFLHNAVLSEVEADPPTPRRYVTHAGVHRRAHCHAVTLEFARREQKTIPCLFISLVVTGLVSLSAVAQNRQPGKDFNFEVLAIHPVVSGVNAGSIGLSEVPSQNGRFTAHVFLDQMVAFAYGTPEPGHTWMYYVKVRNLPAWSESTSYVFDGRIAQSDLKAWQNQGKDHELLRAALRTALKERFNLVLHEELSQQPMYELIVAKGGPKLKAADPNAALPVGVRLESGGVMTIIGARGIGGWYHHNATMRDLVTSLSSMSNGVGPVRDRTGLTGRYDFPLPRVEISADEELVYSYSIDHLGLKLKSGMENRPVLVIDHVEKPSPELIASQIGLASVCMMRRNKPPLP